MIEYLSDLRLFCEISQTLNFRQAGEKLGYSAAVVSMRVKRLETVTGKTLFLRTTRHVVLTEEGRELLNLAQQTLDLAESMSAPRYADLQPEEVRGTVRITAPYSFARVFLSRPLRNIQESFPNLTLELILEDTLTHLVREGIDISFRVGGALDSGVASKELLQDRRILVASPDYLQRFGTPQNPDDLKTHRCLGYVGTKHWHLVKETNWNKQDLRGPDVYAVEKSEVRVSLRNALFCNTGDYLTQLALENAGIAAKSAWSVKAELEVGKLLRVLPNYRLGQVQSIRMLTPKRDQTPVRVRKVQAMLEESILAQAASGHA